MLKIDNGALIYDQADERCKLFVKSSQGNLFAFIAFIDKGCTSHTKQYWGVWDWGNQEQSIREIMENGGKWDNWGINGTN